MLKVQNKRIVLEIAGTTYRANKKRNLVTIFAIILTTCLIAVVIGVGISYRDTVVQRQLRMQGMDYDIELSEPNQEQVEKIRSMDNVKYAGVAVKCAVLEQYRDILLDKTRVYWLDEVCWEKQTMPACESIKGGYPKRENEIMLGQRTLKAMGIERPQIGLRLPFRYTVLAEDGENGTLEKEFILSGWYKDYSGKNRAYISKQFFRTTGVKQTDFTQGTLKISLEHPFYTQKDIVRLQRAIGLERKQYLSADYDTISAFYKTAAVLAALLLMIFVSGYLFIYNTMYLSISKDIRYYGQLQTVGMTSVSLRQMVYWQAAWNALIGIPIGLLVAFVIAQAGIPRLLRLADPGFSEQLVVPVRWWVFLLAGGFSMLTNWLSCRQPAKVAGEYTAIEAMRYTAAPLKIKANRGMSRKKYQNVKRKNNDTKDRGEQSKRKSHRRGNSGIYGMAWQNLFRDKKQAVVIFASFTIAISVFFVVNTIIHENDAERILNETYAYDTRFKNETTLDADRKQLITEEKIAALKNTKGVKAVRRVASAEVVIPYQEEVYGAYFQELYQSRYSPGNYETDMQRYKEQPDCGLFTARFISVDEAGFAVLKQGMELDMEWEEFAQGSVAVAVKYFTEGDNGMTGKTTRFFLPDGRHPNEEYSIQLAAVGDAYDNPAFFAGGYTPDLVVSEAYAEQLLGELFTELVQVEYEEPFSKETERRVKAVFADTPQVSCESKLERYAEMKNTEQQVKILGSSLGVIIGILAALNYLNMLAANVQSRLKEFAILESIGMTERQTKRLLRLEGAGYAGMSALGALLFGIPASYAAFCGMNRYHISYAFPWIRNLVLLAVVFLLCMTAPVIFYKRICKQGIMERIYNRE